MTLEQLTRQNSLNLTLDTALREFDLHQRVSRHSPRTLEYYDFALGRFRSWLEARGVQALEEVGASHIREFMLDLEGSMKPNSVHAIMRGVRALFNFLEREELLVSNPMRKVKMPKLDQTILPAFTETEIGLLMKATQGKDSRDVRNRALVLTLLDTGLRLAECAALKVGDVNTDTGLAKVLGKGRKERVMRLGANSLKAFTKYLRMRGGKVGDTLWIGRQGPMTALGIAETIEKLGKAAGVHAHPHKFRRTCALMMLRNGADIFSVQHLLGHADLGVLRRYLAQTDADIVKAHEKCSPVDGMN
ncbi:MAG: tyrosine-type recombinase/integrase [Fimbriimonadaceae bacterium]|nr:tyrosine-type recombinase/integrase [Fimbriimonadaceae bacterium]